MSGLAIRRPPALRAGDTVMVVAPSGPVRAERIADGLALLSGWGLEVVLGADVYARHGYLAGTDGQRGASLSAALADPGVRGVICARGGYGVQRIVDRLDFDAVARDPKLVLGFSDITALHLALWRGARLAGVHGPVLTQLTGDFPAASVESLRTAIMDERPAVLARDPGAETGPVTVPGPVATGTLLGGNLCLLAATLGTPDFPALDGAVLLVEEVEEPPYKIDRMLTQLRRAGVLRGLAGIALGQFTRCEDEWPMSIVEVLTDRLGDLGVPVLGGLPVGHGEGALTVPVGVPATLDVAAGTLTVRPAVRRAP
jgi:muramoyltetrapeptide carboxypeptidase